MSAVAVTFSRPNALSPILILDSGVGGLSVYTHIHRRLPAVPCVYLADHAGFPYGIKTEAEILQRVVALVESANTRYAPSLVVIACNTASTLVLPELRARLKIPVVGVVPAIKTAAAISKARRIGLLATPGTIAREYTAQLIGSFAPDCSIVRVGSRELVDIAEEFIRGVQPDPEQLKLILQPFFSDSRALDAIVLGCTHFPLLTPALQHAVPYPVHWVDSGDAIARRVEHLLTEAGCTVNTGTQGMPDVGTWQLALSTQEYDTRLQLGIQGFGFDRLELFQP